MKLKGEHLVLAWEQARDNGISRSEFANSIGRTEASARSEIYRTRKQIKWLENIKILVFDIEISPIFGWFWRLGEQYIGTRQVTQDWFIISWAAKWLYGEEIHDVLTSKEAKEKDDKRIVANLWELFDRADILIGHNLKRFDSKKVNWRFKIHDFPPPLPYKMIDTLEECRKYFGATSNKLDALTQDLGLRHKTDTDYQLWLDCVAGKKKALLKMLNYNINDVTITEKLYLEIRPWISNHPSIPLYMNEEVSRCPVCNSKKIVFTDKKCTTAANAYGTYRCTNCNHVGRTKISSTSKTQRKNLLG